MVRKRRRQTELPDHPFQVLPAYRLTHLARFIDFAYSDANVIQLLAELKDIQDKVFGRAAATVFTAHLPHAADRVRTLQGNLRRGLEGLLKREVWELPPLAIEASQRDGKFVSSYAGELDDVFLNECWDRLRGLPVWRLQHCPVNDCNRIFVRTKKALYCSIHATAQARAARYRRGLSNRLTPEEIRRRRHDHYVARVKKLKGAAAAKKVRKFGIRSSAPKRKQAIAERLALEAVEGIQDHEQENAASSRHVTTCPKCKRSFDVSGLFIGVQCPECEGGFVAGPLNTKSVKLIHPTGQPKEESNG